MPAADRCYNNDRKAVSGFPYTPFLEATWSPGPDSPCNGINNAMGLDGGQVPEGMYFSWEMYLEGCRPTEGQAARGKS